MAPSDDWSHQSVVSVGRADPQQERVVPDTAAHFRVNFVRQHSDLVIDPLRDAQPVKTGKSVSDVVSGSHTKCHMVKKYHIVSKEACGL